MKAIPSLALVFVASIALCAQSPPPIQGTIALEGTTKKVYKGANTLIVTTIDGVEHVYRFTKDLLVHGGNGSGVDALQNLREGTTVVVHYTVEDGKEYAREIDRIGDKGLQVTEGTVTSIDRKRKQITIKFDNGRTETLELTERAALDAGKDADATTRVIVYFADEGGHKVAHFFKRAS